MGLKIYLTLALIVLSFITSVGIYGLLSHGFNENIARLEVNSNVISNIEVKKERFKEIKVEKQVEKTNLTKDISELRKQLSQGTRIEYKDKETGQIISTTSRAARKTFEAQLSQSTRLRDTISKYVGALNDSITSLEMQILELQTDETLNGELGVVKYLSDTLDKPIKTISTWLILLLIFVFDPLAITLVVATNQAFKNLEIKNGIYGEPKPSPQLTNMPGHRNPPPPPPPITQSSPPPLEEEINKINNSGYSTKKRKQMIEKLKNEDGKTY